MEKKSLGCFIAFLRKEKGLTQKNLAELLNVSDKTVSHWECDETSPDISILPLLAEILGVTVDELLRGKKKTSDPVPEAQPSTEKNERFFDKAGRKTSSFFSKIKNESINERYRYFRLFSLIGTVIAAVVIISVAVSLAFSGYFFDSSIPVGLITLFGSLWTIVLSLAFTVGARFLFSRELLPEECKVREEKDFIFKANRITYNNIFLLFCAFPLSLCGINIMPIFSNLILAVAFIAAARLTATSVLTKKGYLNKNDHGQILIKYISIFLVSAISVSCAVLFFTEEIYFPSTENIIFDNAADFKAYMETPADKPEEAYLIDGVYATTVPPTIMLTPGRTDEIASSPVQEIPEVQDLTETVCGADGEKILTFIWCNKAVHYYRYDDSDGSFLVITYDAEIRARKQEIFINDFSPVFIALFCIADATVCTMLYKKRKKAQPDII